MQVICSRFFVSSFRRQLCSAPGIRDVYICSGSADPFGALAFRASAGAALSANVYFGDEAVLKVSHHLTAIAVRRAGRDGGVVLMQMDSQTT
jgi:tRNA G18 (ribose-2'-O)-methylase SpoU